MKKGNSIYQFLQRCLENLKKEEVYAELKTASADQLMYVKEDLILPQHSTFFDFIVTKARGGSKSGGGSCVSRSVQHQHLVVFVEPGFDSKRH